MLEDIFFFFGGQVIWKYCLRRTEPMKLARQAKNCDNLVVNVVERLTHIHVASYCLEFN